eukprot:TRINITY_DN12339_c0_g1_i1.p1 TRINITY_DN12339_c0_g1~~TRINITY_DN12339_c0_g1_i1.p1  ORF type:complete len:857 (+),score=205.89 TRINITY_DN12339_c0_g1_i1:71-2572(+)
MAKPLDGCHIVVAGPGAAQLSSSAADLGATISSSVCSETTHLITNVASLVAKKKTAKVSAAIDNPDILVVDAGWLKKCMADNKLVPEGPHSLFGGQAQWEWEADDGESWRPYSSDVSKSIEDAWVKYVKADGTSSVDVSLPGQGAKSAAANPKGMEYLIDFESMDQTNKTTDSSRSVRRNLSSDAQSAVPTVSGSAPDMAALVKKAEEAAQAASAAAAFVAAAAECFARKRGRDADGAEEEPPKKVGLFAQQAKEVADIAAKAVAAVKAMRSAAADIETSTGAPPPAPAVPKRSSPPPAPAPPPTTAPPQLAASPVNVVPVGTKSGGSGLNAGGSKILKKGQGVVDNHFRDHAAWHVIEDGSPAVPLMAMMNQTNLTGGRNNNKFYVVQALEHDSAARWCVWTRWGRQDEAGMNKPEMVGSRAAAISGFKSKFREKTKNPWGVSHADFKKHADKYEWIEMDFGGDAASPPTTAGPVSVKIPECTLDPRVRGVIEMISNKKAMMDVVAELGVDTQRLPLGNLSKDQMKKAYGVLKDIETLMGAKGTRPQFEDLSQRFYTLFPTASGRTRPPVIDSPVLLKQKITLLETLTDIDVAFKIVGGAAIDKNPLDAAYEGLNCNMVPMDKSSDMYKTIEAYVRDTHGPTHNIYRLELEDVFILDRKGETSRYKGAEVGNRMLLWHGSRTTNFMGILSQGLRIAPPEAPATGYMFGKGVYFADMVTKSSNYCCVSPHAATNVGFMLLCDVALGTPFECYGAKYMEKPQPGSHSTKGCGRHIPDTTTYKKIGSGKDEIVVPVGKAVASGMTATSLLYNEFIVYDVAQACMQYMLKVKFVPK